MKSVRNNIYWNRNPATSTCSLVDETNVGVRGLFVFKIVSSGLEFPTYTSTSMCTSTSTAQG